MSSHTQGVSAAPRGLRPPPSSPPPCPLALQEDSRSPSPLPLFSHPPCPLTLQEGRLCLEGARALLLEHAPLGLDVKVGLEETGLPRQEGRNLSLEGRWVVQGRYLVVVIWPGLRKQ